MATNRSHRERRSELAQRELLGNPHTRTLPEFEDESAGEDVRNRMTNAHPEVEYEDMRRLPPVGHMDPATGRLTFDRPGFSSRVRDQVFTQIGERNGTMSFASLMTPAESSEHESSNSGGDPPRDRTTAIPNARAQAQASRPGQTPRTNFARGNY